MGRVASPMRYAAPCAAVRSRSGFKSLSNVPIPPRVPSKAGSTVSKGIAVARPRHPPYKQEEPGACAGLLLLLPRLDRRGDRYDAGSNG